MKRFYVDTIGAMAESITTATNDKVMAAKMQELCRSQQPPLRRSSLKRKHPDAGDAGDAEQLRLITDFKLINRDFADWDNSFR